MGLVRRHFIIARKTLNFLSEKSFVDRYDSLSVSLVERIGVFLECGSNLKICEDLAIVVNRSQILIIQKRTMV